MDAILSSFCFGSECRRLHGEYFYRMPPIHFAAGGPHFVPDYAVTFLFDKIYVDGVSLERVRQNPYYARHIDLIDALAAVGRLQIVDYSAIISPYKSAVASSARDDLRHLASWVAPFDEAVEIWKGLSRAAWNRRTAPDEVLPPILYGGMISGLDYRLTSNLRNWKKRLPDEYRAFTRRIAGAYFEHLAASLCLSDCLGATIHDWSDIGPLYRRKLSISARVKDANSQRAQDECRKLIDIMFPHFTPSSPASLVKALGDPRLESLRQLINAAVQGRVVFDQSFANQTYKEVLSGQIAMDRIRSTTGWITSPLTLIPWVGSIVERAAQAVVSARFEKQYRTGKEWFFLLNEVTTHWN